MIVVDTSGLLSAIDESQAYHKECASLLTGAAPPFLLSPFVLAELDYLLMRHIGAGAQSSFLDEVSAGVYQLESFEKADIARAKEIIDQYADLAIGLADASLVVLAERHSTVNILTLDLRHFRSIRIDRRKRFKIYPFDK